MILCFSATGNSQYCADVLARATDDLVVSVNDCLKHNIRVIDAASSERLVSYNIEMTEVTGGTFGKSFLKI